MWGISAIPRFRMWGGCPPFRVSGFSAIPRFRIWGDFPPFRVLGFSAIPCFRIWGNFPPFRHSTIPRSRVGLLGYSG